MCSVVSSTDGGGVLIFFFISAQNIDAGESQGEVIHGCSHNILFYVAMFT